MSVRCRDEKSKYPRHTLIKPPVTASIRALAARPWHHPVLFPSRVLPGSVVRYNDGNIGPPWTRLLASPSPRRPMFGSASPRQSRQGLRAWRSHLFNSRFPPGNWRAHPTVPYALMRSGRPVGRWRSPSNSPRPVARNSPSATRHQLPTRFCSWFVLRGFEATSAAACPGGKPRSAPAKESS